MAFINYKAKEDMQDETFKAVTAYLLETIEARREKDLYRSFDYLDSLWTLIHSRVNDEAIQKKIDYLTDKIYRRGEINEIEANNLLDEVRAVQMSLTAVLEKKGLLFKMYGKPGELVTMG